MEYINKTGLSFAPGQKLSAEALSKMNDTINLLVGAVNNMLRVCDVNVEIDDFSRVFELEEAITMMSNTRRALGMKLRFLGTNKKYVEYSFIGDALDNNTWLDPNNWETGPDVIDGGEW